MFVFLISVLCMTAQGENEVISVVDDVSPFAVANMKGSVINVFDETNEGWDASGGDITVTLAEKIKAFPYSSLTGDGSLIVRTENAHSGNMYYIEKNYTEPLDLSNSESLFFFINCLEVCGASYSVSVSLYSEEDVFSGASTITGESWNGVFLDISRWENKSSVNRISIAAGFNSDDFPVAFFEYYIDCIMVSDNRNVVMVPEFSALGYDINGGDGVYSEGVLGITASGDELILDSVGFAYTDLGEANCLRVNFKTEGLCQTLRLFLKEEGGFVEQSYVHINANKGMASVCLSLEDKTVNEIRLVFEGVKLGSVKVYGITPDSAVLTGKNDVVGIETCVLNSKTEEILIKGKIDRSVLTFEKGEIHLFANDLCDKITEELLISSEPLGVTSIFSDDFIFRLKYADESDKKVFLHKKFTVAVKNGAGYDAIGDSKCVTNPESFNADPGQMPSEKSGKGVYKQNISFMQKVGASDTIVRVDVGKFFTLESESGVKIECGGYVFYYDNEYFSGIDRMIKNYAEKNIDVTIIFVVSKSDEDALCRALIHKEADPGAKYCAFNTSDKQGLMYLRAVAEFFASRYCTDHEVTRFVFGDCVGNAYSNYNMGRKNLAEFTDEYAVGLRTVYNAVKSFSPYFDVYTYIDDVWSRGFPFDLNIRYDSKAFLDSLNKSILGMGDIEWSLAHNPYPANTTDHFSYEEIKAANDCFVERVGFKNLGVIIEYLNSTEMLYNNSSRDYIIIEQSAFSNLGEDYITADYVYCSYMAMNSSVSAYFTDRNCNYNNSMKYIDTSLSLTASAFAADILGVATWESVIDGFSYKNIEKRKIISGEISVIKPEVIGEYTLFDFGKDTNNWKRYGFTEGLAHGSDFADRTGLLSVSLGNVMAGNSGGVIKEFDSPFDFSKTPVLHFSLNISALPTNVYYADISVIVTSGNDVFEMTGSIKEASWTEVYCDLSEFSGKSKVDSISILFNANEDYYDSPQVHISSVDAMSYEYDNEQLQNMINPMGMEKRVLDRIKYYIYPILILIVIICSAVFAVRRIGEKKI